MVIFPLVHYKEGENPWVSYARQQTMRKNNCINLISIGAPGSGKSWALLSYFNLINPDFSVEEDCFFHAKDLLNLFREDKINKGKPIMYDESGIDTNSLKWQDEVNRGLNAFFQTSRHRNYIFGMTVPFQSFVSKGVRTLMNCKFIAKGWNSDNKTIIKPLTMEWNDEQVKFYSKRLIVQHKGGKNFCDEIKLPKPPENKIKIYEKLKKEFTTQLYEEIGKKIEAKEEDQKRKALPRLTLRQEQVIKCIQKNMVMEEMKEELNCGQATISGIISGLRNKGIKIDAKPKNDNFKGTYLMDLGIYGGVYGFETKME